MVTSRTALARACLTLAMLTTAACVQVNEAINRRDLECTGVPEDVCTTIADDIARLWDATNADATNAAQDGPIVSIRVQPIDCAVAFEVKRPEMARCWITQMTTAVSAGAGKGAMYYQKVDGQLFGPIGVVLGLFPVE